MAGHHRTGEHTYRATVAWEGSTAGGYTAYTREHDGAVPPASDPVAVHPGNGGEDSHPWIESAAEGAQGRASTPTRVRLDDGRVLDYDVLSLDVGGSADVDAIDGASRHALFVRPVEAFARVVGMRVPLDDQ